MFVSVSKIIGFFFTGAGLILYAHTAWGGDGHSNKKEVKWERNGCKYEYKRDGGKIEEKYECDDDDEKHYHSSYCSHNHSRQVTVFHLNLN